MQTFLGEVIALVSDAFKDRVDKSGVPYVLHCFAVMEGAKARGVTDVGSLAAAFAHDLFEDREDRFKEFRAICRNHHMSYVPGYVLALSRAPNESYKEFIEAVIKFGILDVIKIKMADLDHNSQITRLKGITDSDIRRIKKYHRSYLELDRAANALK